MEIFIQHFCKSDLFAVIQKSQAILSFCCFYTVSFLKCFLEILLSFGQLLFSLKTGHTSLSPWQVFFMTYHSASQILLQHLMHNSSSSFHTAIQLLIPPFSPLLLCVLEWQELCLSFLWSLNIWIPQETISKFTKKQKQQFVSPRSML